MNVSIAQHDKDLFPPEVVVEVHPDVMYDSIQAAAILCIRGKPRSRFSALYRIPQTMLPVQRRGPKGGKRGYLGRDLLNYREGR